jgi:Zn-dependent alcohol dehydrogenase
VAADRLVKFYNFSDINQAMADARRGDTIKPVVRISTSESKFQGQLS